MRYSLIFLLSILFFSCQNKLEKLKEDIKPIITQRLISDSVIYKLDSLTIFKIDTLTELRKQVLIIKSLEINKSIFYTWCEFYKKYSEQYLDMGTKTLNDAETHRNLLGDNVLSNTEASISIEQLNQGKTYLNKAQLYLDSTDMINAKIGLIDSIINAKGFDSTIQIGYIVHYNIIGADRNGNEIKRDSLTKILSKELNFIKLNDN
jgi:hypothetical protein